MYSYVLFNQDFTTVWGPDPVRLGFIGAPIAIAISYNLIAILTAIYAVVYAPKAAWHPLSRRMFFNLGVLVRLGLSGVGASDNISSQNRLSHNYSSDSIRVVGLGNHNSRFISVSICMKRN